MILTATPEPAHTPPRVRLDLTANAGETISDVTVTRDGSAIRDQPFAGAGVSLSYDYESPFGAPAVYEAVGDVLLPIAADWTEAWASLADWTGDTGSFTVSGGNAKSVVPAKQIVRSASGAIQRLDVTNPVYVRVELLDASDVVVASVQVDSKVSLVAESPISAVGGGSFAMSFSAGVVTAAAADSSWALTRPYVGTPEKVRVVALVGGGDQTLSFGTTGAASGVALDSTGRFYVGNASTDREIRKYNLTGHEQTGGGFPILPPGLCRGLIIDSADNLYTKDITTNKIRKYSSTGIEQTTGGFPISTPFASYYYSAMAVDSAGSLYADGSAATNKIHKYSSTGIEQTTGGFPITTAAPTKGLAVDGSGNIYQTDTANKIHKYSSTGIEQTTGGFPITTAGSAPYGVSIGSSGSIWVADTATNAIHKYNSAGELTVSIPTTGRPDGLTSNSSAVIVADATNTRVREFVELTTSVGTMVETPVASSVEFDITATAQLDVDEAWLIHPTFSSLSASIDPGQHKFRDIGLNVEVTTKTSVGRAAKTTRHDPSGRRRAVIFTSGPRAAGEWDLKLYARTLADRDTVDTLCDDQSSLLLRTPPTWPWDLPDGWYSVGDYAEERPRPRLDTPDRLITLPLTPVEEPMVKLAEVWNYAANLLRNPTYADARAEFPTYLDRLIGP